MDLTDFIIRDGVLEKYDGVDDDIVIPDGVVEIGESAFEDSTIRSVIIPEGVKTIGELAFSNCMFLEDVVIAPSVTTIGFRAFAECDELTVVTIPEGVTELPPGLFWGCTSLTNVVLPRGLLRIGGGAFQGCEALTNIYLPLSVTEIGSSAFAFCENLVSISIQNNVKVIEASAFEECSKLSRISLPVGLKRIEDYAFQLSGLKSIDFDGTKAQWEAIIKGKDWNKGTSIQVKCTDSKVSQKNKIKKIKLSDFKKHGINVKVTTIVDWDPLRNLSYDEANLVWAANYELAKRRIAYMLISFFLLAATIGSFFLPTFNEYYYVSVILALVSIIFIIMSSFWRKQLSGYKFFCKIHNFPAFNGFATFLYYICRIIGFLYFIVGIIFVFIIAFITSASAGSGFSFYDRLGIPQNIGYDDLIELGFAHDEAAAAAWASDIEAVFNEIDYTISKNMIESDYQVKKDKIDEAFHKIGDLEKDSDNMTFEEKQKLKELKEKAETAQSKLDKSYEDAKNDLEQAHNDMK